MFYRILTKNGVDNTNIDGARDHNFNAGRRSGIVKGALNSGNLFLSANNTIALDTCELRLCGHRVVIDSAEYKTFYNQPSVPIRYSLVAQIIVSNNGESVSFDLKTQLSTTPLVQNDLDKNINGTYELEIGRFTQLTDGTLTDVVRTADLITGGGNNDSEYIRIGTVTTNKISPELDADVDIENTINPDDNKPQTNFTFNLPTPSGTVVSVAGEEKTSINTDTTPTANSQNLVTSGGVHDYPAITFAESERQKSKNLCCLKNESVTDAGVTMIYDSINQTIELNGTSTGDVNIMPNIRNILPIISNSLGKTYSFTILIESGNVSENFGAYLGSLDSDIWSDRFTIWFNKTDTSSSITFTVSTNHTYDTLFVYLLKGTVVNNLKLKVQIEEGSVATDYQPYNGAIVHEKEIADVERIETIYEMNTKNTIGGVPYTAGIPFSNITISNVDFTSYKYLRFTCRWNEHLDNWFGGAITFDLDLTTPYNADAMYMSVVSNRPSSCYIADNVLTFDLVGLVIVNANKNSLSVKGYKITYTGERTAYTSDNYLPYFRIEKIEGVK